MINPIAAEKQIMLLNELADRHRRLFVAIELDPLMVELRTEIFALMRKLGM